MAFFPIRDITVSCRLPDVGQQFAADVLFFCFAPGDMPRGVERIEMPMPPSTRGISPAPTYLRRPGLLTRFKPVMAEVRFTILLMTLICGNWPVVSTS